ncbi:MAG TPA: GTPase Era [Thermodesulfovibrionales bacterium]|nr:GTPase Era [Thermodesulfovibrionales bacterium]
MPAAFRSGFVALIGRPNVGKSTILNAVLGQKIAIVTHRQQTTRNRLLGIRNLPSAQIIFIDTPGIHSPQHALGRAMVRSAREALDDIDIVVFVTDAERQKEQDVAILDMLGKIRKPALFVLNKTDRKSRAEIAGIVRTYGEMFPFDGYISLSGLKEKGIDRLLEKLRELLPAGPKYYDDDMVTDQYERFMAAEIIREKIIKNTSEEVPHAVAVEITEWKEKDNGLVSVRAVIYVEREGQKGIIIGKKGELLKTIGKQARMDLEKLIGARVFLELWVKVKKGWRDDRKMLQALGYH